MCVYVCVFSDKGCTLTDEKHIKKTKGGEKESLATMNAAVTQEAYRIEAMMCAMRNECLNLCCKDLSTGEMSVNEVDCVDRCSWRYMRTHKIITSAGGKDAKMPKKL